LKTHHRRHCELSFDKKCTRLHDFAHTISKYFLGWYPDPHSGRGRPFMHSCAGKAHRCSAWAQTLISAWLISVPLFLFYEMTTGLNIRLRN